MEDAPVDKPKLTFRRLSGLDRSGPPPPETQAGAPLRPWTIPNVIGYVRGLLVPVFLVLALQSESGTDALPAVLFAIIGWGDYADGIAARVTRQYSRMGALLDPLIDRMLIISGVIVCWHFDLLPRWGLAVLTARELFMIGLARYAMYKQAEMKINWLGRWGVWPVFSALFFALCNVDWLALICLYVGLVLVLGSTVQYVRAGLRMARGQGSS